MSDLNSKDSSLLVSVVGVDSTTGETNPVNANADGELLTKSKIINSNGTDINSTTPLITAGAGTAGLPFAGVTTVQGIQGGVAQRTLPLAPYASNSYPNPIQAYPDANAQSFGNDFSLNADVYGNLQIRGPVITDEVSSRNDFTGASLSTTLTGTVKFLSNSTEVTGVGTAFTSQVRSGWYIRRTAGTDSEYVQVDYVQDDNTLYLVSVYSGNHNNVPFQQTEYKPTTVGGASNTVGSSLLNLISSTASGNSTIIENQGDYLPFNIQFAASITQRIANQTSFIGFRDNALTPTLQASVVFDGTTNTTVKFVSSASSAGADTQTTTVTLPSAAVTSSINTYQIDLVPSQACLLINGILVATHSLHLPGPYDVLKVTAGISNAAVVTTTTLSLDYILFSNQNRLNIGNDFQSDPISTLGYGRTATNAVKELLVGASGENLSTDHNTTKTSYSAASSFTMGLLSTDIFTLTGSATKTIRVTRIQISATQSTASAANIFLVKRSTANTGGTATTLTAVPLDSTNVAATAVARSYTANPTTGTLVGNLRVNKLFVSAASGSPGTLDWKFGEGTQAIYLRGATEVLSVNLNAATLMGNSFNIFIEWTEET